MWCPEGLSPVGEIAKQAMMSKSGSFFLRFIFFAYASVPFYVNSLTVGAMALERFLLICRATSARHSWFFKRPNLVYSVLSVLFIIFPFLLIIFQYLCFVIFQPSFMQNMETGIVVASPPPRGNAFTGLSWINNELVT